MANPSKTANCEVLGDGCGANDHSHVSMTTPFKTKRKEYENDPMYKTDNNSDLDPKREAATTRARRNDARPLGGNK
jgi:hypothetical protein